MKYDDDFFFFLPFFLRSQVARHHGNLMVKDPDHVTAVCLAGALCHSPLSVWPQITPPTIYCTLTNRGKHA